MNRTYGVIGEAGASLERVAKMAASQPAPRDARPSFTVGDQVDSLNNNITELQSIIDAVETRLRPVLTQIPPQTAERSRAEPDRAETYAAELSYQNRRLREASAAIMGLMDRLEL